MKRKIGLALKKDGDQEETFEKTAKSLEEVMETSSIPQAEQINMEETLKMMEGNNQDSPFHFRFIPLEKIQFNKKNDYEMVDIEKLANTILRQGLIHSTASKYDIDTDTYTLISGERRTRAILFLIDKFKNGELSEADKKLYQKNISYYSEHGIPTKVEMEMNDLDEEINLIIANEEIRTSNAAQRAKKIQRLNELYALKNDSGANIPITKQISEDLGISRKQVQQYNAINNNLIPKLKEEFEKNSFNVKTGSSIARLSEEEQNEILKILKEGKKIDNTELEAVKKMKALSDERVSNLEKQLSEKEKEMIQLKENLKTRISENEQILLALQKNSNENKLLEEKLRKEIAEELSGGNNENKIAELEKKLENTVNNNHMLESEMQRLKSEGTEKQSQIKNLQDQLLELKNKATPIELSELEKQQLKYESQFEMLELEFNNQLLKIQSLFRSYKDNYEQNEKAYQFINRIKKAFEKSLNEFD